MEMEGEAVRLALFIARWARNESIDVTSGNRHALNSATCVFLHNAIQI